jgi:hypothetical protein
LFPERQTAFCISFIKYSTEYLPVRWRGESGLAHIWAVGIRYLPACWEVIHSITYLEYYFENHFAPIC